MEQKVLISKIGDILDEFIVYLNLCENITDISWHVTTYINSFEITFHYKGENIIPISIRKDKDNIVVTNQLKLFEFDDLASFKNYLYSDSLKESLLRGAKDADFIIMLKKIGEFRKFGQIFMEELEKNGVNIRDIKFP